MLIFSLLQDPIYLMAFIVALLIGFTIHEYAHAWMAFRCGDPTAKIEGRLTLNPLAHLDPMGTIFLLLVGFGWGKPVPIDPSNFNNRSDEIKVALSGIVANLILAFIFGIPLRVATLTGQPIDSSIILSAINIIVDINLVLATFNILPIFPLDGSRIAEHFMSDDSIVAFRQYGPMILLAILIFDRVSNYPILYTVMEPILRLLSFLTKGTFSFFI